MNYSEDEIIRALNIIEKIDPNFVVTPEILEKVNLLLLETTLRIH